MMMSATSNGTIGIHTSQGRSRQDECPADDRARFARAVDKGTDRRKRHDADEATCRAPRRSRPG
jgi:hypothetical protein